MIEPESNVTFKAHKAGLMLGFFAFSIVTFVAPALLISQERSGLFFHGNFSGGWGYKSIILFVLAFLAFGYWLFSYLYSSWFFKIDQSGIFQKGIFNRVQIPWDNLLLVVINKYGEIQFYSKDAMIRTTFINIKNRHKALNFINNRCPGKFCTLKPNRTKGCL